MLGGTKINIDILVGLPGSGKTYYAQHVKKNNKVYLYRVDFDKHRNAYPGLSAILNKYGVSDEIFWFNSESHLIFDGLFTTHETQDKIVKEWLDLFEKNDENKTSKCHIKFVYFKENRDACFVNDSFRDKERQAKVTIKTAKLERPDPYEYNNTKGYDNERITFSIEEMEVHKMDKYEGIFKPLRNSYWSNKLGYDVMTSEEWRTGGTLCSYDGWKSEVEPEKQPHWFTKFDDLLEKYCPGISFLTYKKLYNECVTINEGYENDYYGGTQYYSVYCCNLGLLYNMLKERGYLTEEKNFNDD